MSDPGMDGVDGMAVRANDVAVIGMCGRFPGAEDVARFWRRLRAGDDMLTTYTDAELAAAGAPERVLRDSSYVKRAAVLPDAFDFDHEFFGYTQREGKLLDPQQRVQLEVAWELLETVGYAGGAGDQAIGVFAGASMNTYLTNVVARACDPLGYDGTELMIANDKDYLTTRISYKLGLKGPSLNVQTACSTSLVAVHLAVQSLLTGECDIAMAGGVSVIANDYPGYTFSEGMILSPDGRCRPFDADGAGTTFGDGVGLVALKRLAEAIEDGDQILAVVKGSAINNDGSDKIGYTAPSVGGQRAVISEAQAVADVESDTITYVEAHGTATVLGDPIEFAALSEAFTDGGARPGQCALGSAKANVGHLAAAAGITGFIKAVLALRHREIPGHPSFTRPNPQIDLAGSPFYINTLPMAWPPGETPRRAGVSSFGIGGTNAHVILEEAPSLPAPPRSEGPQVFAVSAKSESALRELAGRLADVLEAPDAPGLADAAYTLQQGRRTFAHRYAVAADDHASAVAGLRALAEGKASSRSSAEPAVSLLFGEVTDEELRELTAQLAAVAERNTGQPGALVLATLWTESGVQAAAAGGAGAGEVLAACFAGAFDPSDAVALLSWRAGLLDRAPELDLRVPAIPILSAVVGGELPQSRVLDPQYWTRDVWDGDRLAEAFADRTVLAIGGSPPSDEQDRPPVTRLLTAAARLWTEGVPVDWSDWSGERPSRVPLPGHPLNRVHLRLEPPTAVPSKEEPARTDLLYTQSWQRLGPAANAVSTLPDGPWLLFADSGGVGDSLAEALRARDAVVVLVRHGNAFSRAEDGSFTIDPANPADYGKLFDLAPQRVVHLWSLDIAPGDDLDGACDLGLFSVLDLAKRLDRGNVHLTVVARDVHDITGGEAGAPAAAMTEAALEGFPGLRCRAIDLGTDTIAPPALLAEVAAPSAAPVAFRNDRRWTSHFVPVAPSSGASRLRTGGVYLVTGGLGRTGLALAGHLARVAGAKLVLTGRTALPSPDGYDRWIAEHGAADPVSRKIESVRAVERLGGTVMMASADVTDVAAMRDLVGAARQRFGRVDGWFHCAAAPERGAGRREVLAPKVRGAQVLTEVFADAPADFGVTLASAAASRFLDAQAASTGGLISVNWDGSLTPEQRNEVFDLVLGTDMPPRIVVSATEPNRRVKTERPRPEPPRRLGGEELKKALAHLWSEVLRTEVDRYDLSIFDLGGDELLAVRLARRIEEGLGVPLTAIELLSNSTIDHLAARLDPDRTPAPSRRRAGRRRETV